MGVAAADTGDEGSTQLAFKIGNVPKAPLLDYLLQGEIVGVPAPVLEGIENDALRLGELLQVLRLGMRSGDGLIHEHYARTPRLLKGTPRAEGTHRVSPLRVPSVVSS